MDFKLFIKSFSALVTTNLLILLGGYDKLLHVLVICIAVDYITGICKAVKEGTLNSYIGFFGIVKKILLLSVIALAVGFDTITELGTPLFRTLTIAFYISNEAISIFENLTCLGIPFPDVLKNKLKNYSDDENE
jgi:toxin secretion/phage lysis holin